MADGPLRRLAATAACGMAVLLGAAFAAAPAGSATAAPALYTAAQGKTGAALYATTCAQCHGENLEGGVGPALTGPNLVRLAKKTKLTVGDFFQFMALQMPLNAPASLPKDKYAAILAYILARNHYPSGTKPLTYDAAMKATAIMTTYPAH